jgi:hypothetical protein
MTCNSPHASQHPLPPVAGRPTLIWIGPSRLPPRPLERRRIPSPPRPPTPAAERRLPTALAPHSQPRRRPSLTSQRPRLDPLARPLLTLAPPVTVSRDQCARREAAGRRALGGCNSWPREQACPWAGHLRPGQPRRACEAAGRRRRVVAGRAPTTGADKSSREGTTVGRKQARSYIAPSRQAICHQVLMPHRLSAWLEFFVN